MDDIISRQAAIDALVKRTNLTWERLKIIYPMLDVFEALPSAERRGRWIDLKCNQCGQVDMSKPNYCPNCGAKMDDDTLGPGSYRVVGGRGGNE